MPMAMYCFKSDSLAQADIDVGREVNRWKRYELHRIHTVADMSYFFKENSEPKVVSKELFTHDSKLYCCIILGGKNNERLAVVAVSDGPLFLNSDVSTLVVGDMVKLYTPYHPDDKPTLLRVK